MINYQYKFTDTAKKLLELGIDLSPTRGTDKSAGIDLRLCSMEPVVIQPYETVKVFTGLHIYLGVNEEEYEISVDSIIQKKCWIPYELAGLYLPRSSNKGLQLENTVGLLDADYQGESFLKLYNKTEETIILQPGERIAQLVIFPALMLQGKEVREFVTQTKRGEGGDGSTGRF